MKYIPSIVIAIVVLIGVALGLYYTKNANCLWGFFLLGFAVDAIPDEK